MLKPAMVINGVTQCWIAYGDGRARRIGMIERDGSGFRPALLRVNVGYQRLRKQPTLAQAEAAILAAAQRLQQNETA